MSDDLRDDPPVFTGPVVPHDAPPPAENPWRQRAEQAEAAIERAQTLGKAWASDPLRMRAATELASAINDTPPTLGARLRSMRLAKGFTIVGLAAAAKMSPYTIRNIETGKTTPLASSLDALAAALDVPRAALDQPPSDRAAHQ